MKKIEVVAYDAAWPKAFKKEADLIRTALGEHCIAVHHVGSTSVPGLAAKPKIDIVAVIKDAGELQEKLGRMGYVWKGEFNIPFQYGFSKREPGCSVNLHVFDILPQLKQGDS